MQFFLCNFPKDAEFGDELTQELEKRNRKVVRAYAKDFVMDLGDGTDTKACLVWKGKVMDVAGDLFFMKSRKPYLTHAALLLQFVTHLGARHLNPGFEEHVQNIHKQAQYISLIKHGFRIPRTLLICGEEVRSHREYIEGAFSYPIVVKASGSGGKFVWKVTSFEELSSVVASIPKKRREVLVLQEFITQSHEEYRALFFLEKLIAVIIRSSESFRNNYAQGGSVRAGVIDQEEEAHARRAAKISKLDYVAVDYMKDETGNMIFMELQTGPSLTVSKLADEKVVSEMAQILDREFKEKMD